MIIKKECWYKNTTGNDILLNDIGIKIRAFKEVDLFKLKPTLNSDMLTKSEISGLIKKCTSFEPPKLIKLPCGPDKKPDIFDKSIQISSKPIPSRVKTSVIVDQHEKDYIEDMEADNLMLNELNVAHYAESADGTSDPMYATRVKPTKPK